MSDFVDNDALEEEFKRVMGAVEQKATLSLVIVNHSTGQTDSDTMAVEDVQAVNENKTVIVGREYGSNAVTKITIEYVEEANDHA